MSKKYSITITLLSLAAVLCVLLGKSVIQGPGFTVSYAYINALFPADGSSWRTNAVIYLWLLTASGVFACILAWIPKVWAVLAGCVVCVSSPLYHLIRNAQNGYSIFSFDGTMEVIMFVLPLITTVVFILQLRVIKQEY